MSVPSTADCGANHALRRLENVPLSRYYRQCGAVPQPVVVHRQKRTENRTLGRRCGNLPVTAMSRLR